ncbi:hypothetical protein PACTADRAFT_33041 [Pachysolen tannophilus NRRL Y-2460]|uniref:Uncharacterized protein n=1 Tax=Pachysolen tannophilus NRRL Y-2460 TaxID=669874 RepID=A0A1E4TVS8_PACTA|nr:hypothetical protein PACTADRAFT_33041 [Pachysolen tannophilus NRRL Y-2460]
MDYSIEGIQSIDINNDSSKYIDITDQFFDVTKVELGIGFALCINMGWADIKHGEIVKAKSFSLFQGTHALEMMNKRLDTGLVELSKEEREFDVTAGRNFDEVLAIMNDLLKYLMSWLNNSSLSRTILSCRYVEVLLVNYCTGNKSLASCRFGANVELKDDDDEESLLIHKVLRSFILGCLEFVKFVLFLGQQGVLYEEEDINTTSMGLDILSKISKQDIINELEKSINWLQKFCNHMNKNYMIDLLLMINNLIKPNLLTITITFDQSSSPKPKELLFLQESLKIAKSLKSNKEFFSKLPQVPKGCLSQGVQRRLDNGVPLTPLNMDPFDSVYDSFINMIQDILVIFELINIQNINHINLFIMCFMNKREDPIHIIARAFLQLFYIREDRSIMGDPKTRIDSLLLKDLISLTCCDSKIFQEYENYEKKGSKINNHNRIEYIDKFLELLANLENNYYSNFLTISQNPCRQRQHFNRSILTWDTLQVQSEMFEQELFQKYNINDFYKVDGNNNDHHQEEIQSMPISSWIYYHKLKSMLEVVLRGVELEIYKKWELYSIFWYSSYLYEILIEHLHRIQHANSYKKNLILNMPKKIKKLKSGEKKQQLKEIYKIKSKQILPQLIEIETRLEQDFTIFTILKNLSDCEKYLFSILDDLKLLELPKLNMVPESLSYGLKMKPFQSVGVPEFPTFTKWQMVKKSLQTNVDTKEKKLHTLTCIKKLCDFIKTQISDTITKLNNNNNNNNKDKNENGKSQFTDFVQKELTLWHNQLLRSCIGISLTCSLLSKQLVDPNFQDINQIHHKYTVLLQRDGYHRYFPCIKVVENPMK